MKHTKQALLLSALSLMLCISMLVGTTFAWFTDSVTTGVNTIQSGNLDVDLVDANNNSLEGKTLNFKKTETAPADEAVLWEPGCKYELDTFKIVNKGSLALKYQIVISAAQGDVKLLEAIEFTVAAGGETYDSLAAYADAMKDIPLEAGKDSGNIVITGHMKEEAGNEYMGLTVTGIAITVMATQYTHETDSFNNQYDKDADYAIAVDTYQDLQKALNLGQKVVLEKDVVIPQSALTNDPEVCSIPYGLAIVNSNAVIDLNGNDLVVEAQDGAALFVKDGSLKIVGEGNVKNTGNSGYVVWAKGASTVDVYDGDFFAGGDDTTLFYASGNVAYDETSPWATINIYGGTYTNEAVGDSVQDFLNVMNHGVGRINIYGGTFDFDPQNTKWGDDAKYITVADGYTVVKTSDGMFSVVEGVSDNAGFNAAVAAGKEKVVLGAGNYEMPSVDLRGKTLNIVGTEGTVIDVSKIDARNQFVTGATLSFEGVTLNFGYKNYMGFANTKTLTYKDCKITGLQFLYGDEVIFENCEIDSSANTQEPHAVWTYGAKNVSFTGCDFTYGNRGINCYSDNDVDGGKQTVNFKNCTFTTTDVNSEGAVEINSSKFSVGIEVNLEGCTAPAIGELAYVSQWDSSNGAKTTINVK